jgi:hypothetical protein
MQIVSGAQTGTDRAALDAAISLKCDTGGWCPKGRIAEDGIISDIYLVNELDTKGYRQRTKKTYWTVMALLLFILAFPKEALS